VKCGQYWEPIEENIGIHGNFQIRTISVNTNEDYTIASLELKNLKVSFVFFNFL
jgi:tyrosine-protein phosphatase non-receptor type 9